MRDIYACSACAVAIINGDMSMIADENKEKVLASIEELGLVAAQAPLEKTIFNCDICEQATYDFQHEMQPVRRDTP